MKATKRDVKAWLLRVAVKCHVTFSERELQDLLSLMVPTFMTHYAAEAFCTESLDAVTSAVQYFQESPIRGALDAWCRTNAPPDQAALPPEVANSPLTDVERTWAATWYRAPDDRQREDALNVMRGYCQPAFAWLVNIDFAAANLAVRKGWAPEADRVGRMQIEWGDPMVVEAAVRSCLGHHNDGTRSPPTRLGHYLGLLRAIVSRYAPQNLPLIPEPGDV